MRKIIFAILGCALSVSAFNPYEASTYVVKRRVADMSALFDSTASLISPMIPQYVQLVSTQRALSLLPPFVGKKLPIHDSTVMAAAETLVNLMEADAHPKAEKARKDLNKGKLHKDCATALVQQLATLNDAMAKHRVSLADRRRKLQNLQRIAEDGSIDQLTEMDGVRILSIYDTVANPLFNCQPELTPSQLDSLQHREQIAGWEWTATEELVPYEASFPKKEKYHYFKNHPEYAVEEDDRYARRYLFDRQGNLTRVVHMTIDELPVPPDWYDFETFIYREAWANNAYNIKSTSRATQHYLKVRMGLEDLTAAEKAQEAKRDKAMSRAIRQRLNNNLNYGNNAFTDYLNSQADMRALNTPGGLKSTDDGNHWMQQIRMDYKDVFSRPYKVERIDGVTFLVTFVDENLVPIYQATYKYIFRKPIDSSNTLGAHGTITDLKKLSGGESLRTVYQPKTMVFDETLPADANIDYLPQLNTLQYFAQPYVDRLPRFGNTGDAQRYIADNFVWTAPHGHPYEAVVTLNIEPDGNLSWIDTQLLDIYEQEITSDHDISDELMRLFTKMGKWQPAMLDGKPVRSRIYCFMYLSSTKKPSFSIIDDSTRDKIESSFSRARKPAYESVFSESRDSRLRQKVQ